MARDTVAIDPEGGDTDELVTGFDPNYQGDPATKLDSPADGNVAQTNAERDLPACAARMSP